MLSSKALPVRIVSMDILLHGTFIFGKSYILGIQFLRNFDNQLLPMVHQNWLVLVNRLDDSELESRRATFMVGSHLSFELFRSWLKWQKPLNLLYTEKCCSSCGLESLYGFNIMFRIRMHFHKIPPFGCAKRSLASKLSLSVVKFAIPV